MPRLRSLSLRVHLGQRSLTWTLIHRTDDGRSVWDRRLHAGTLALEEDPSTVLDVVSVLRETLRHLDDRPSIGYTAQRPGAPGGDGGRLTVPLAAVCPGQCPHCGSHLDSVRP